jgi:hypothetical protein
MCPNPDFLLIDSAVIHLIRNRLQVLLTRAMDREISPEERADAVRQEVGKISALLSVTIRCPGTCPMAQLEELAESAVPARTGRAL